MSIRTRLTFLSLFLCIVALVIAGSIFFYDGGEALNVFRQKFILSGAIALAVVAAISLLVSKRFGQPIVQMAAIVERIRNGELDLRIPDYNRKDFGLLSARLNEMIARLNDDIRKLKKLERVRSEFLGNVSHELRTPIFAIQGMLETLLHGALEDMEVNRNFVERALANTQRLNTLLGDLIEISRIESGEMKMSFRYLDVRELLETVTREMEPVAEQKRVTLRLCQTDPSIKVLGDKERLKQVLVNLIDNAIKYIPDGGTITVACVPLDGRAEVSVSDTGVGIAEEHLPRIFERFYRVDKERSREAGGTGLGLAIVKHIVEAHESKVEVRSEVGKGSTFSFQLKM